MTDFLSTLKFGHLTREDINQKYVYTEKDHPICNTISKKDNKIIEKNKLYLTSEHYLIGAITCKYMSYIPELDLHVFYVGAICTYDSPLTLPSVYTKGRLLWAYLLHHLHYYLYNLVGPTNILVYNSSIASAIGYHLKMGMKRYTTDLFPSHFIPRIIQCDGECMKTIMSEDYNFLFYQFDPSVNYNSIDSILLSLPPSEKSGGTKRNTRKKYSKRR